MSVHSGTTERYIGFAECYVESESHITYDLNLRTIVVVSLFRNVFPECTLNSGINLNRYTSNTDYFLP